MIQTRTVRSSGVARTSRAPAVASATARAARPPRGAVRAGSRSWAPARRSLRMDRTHSAVIAYDPASAANGQARASW